MKLIEVYGYAAVFAIIFLAKQIFYQFYDGSLRQDSQPKEERPESFIADHLQDEAPENQGTKVLPYSITL